MAEPHPTSSAFPPGAAPAGTPDAAAGAEAPHCPWCAAPAAADADRCTACGAALAQRETIGGLMIPGLTSVDPVLQDFDKRPLHISGPSPSQGMAPALIVGAVAGGPAGIAAIGGVAALAAVEYLGAGRGGAGSVNLEDVGRPSDVVLQALGRVEDGTIPDGPEVASPAPGTPVEAKVDPAEADHGRSIWRDLPPVGDSNEPRDEEAMHGDG
jgi:hypothetical protein